MTKFESLKIRVLVLTGVILALALVVVFRPSTSSTRLTQDLPALLPGFSSANVAAIELRQGASLKSGTKERLVTLARALDADTGAVVWTVTSSHGYPANDVAVSKLLSELAKARIGREATRRPEEFGSYVDDGAWVEVTLRGEDAKAEPLARVGVGKSSWQSGETNVRLGREGSPDDPPRVVRVRDFSAESARAAPEAWFESRLFKSLESDQVERIDVVQRVELDGKASARTITLLKKPAEKPPEPKDGEPPAPPPERTWVMLAPDQAPASRADVLDLVRAFTGMLFENVVDDAKSAESDAKYGFDAPEVTATVTLPTDDPRKPAPRHMLVLGKKNAETGEWYVRRPPDTYVFTVKENDSLGRFRNDPSKYKEAVKEPETPKEPAPAAPVPGGAPAPGPTGDPDGPTPPVEPAPATPPDAPKAPEAPKPPPDAPPAPDEKPLEKPENPEKPK